MKLCEHYVFGKHKPVKFNTSIHTTEGILDYVHANLWGEGGFLEALTWCFPYFLKHKSDAFDAFKAWKVMVKKQTERKVKILCNDNGMKFCSNEFKLFCRKEGIVKRHTIPHTPRQNGVAERLNRTII
jgi:hypothetical protein